MSEIVLEFPAASLESSDPAAVTIEVYPLDEEEHGLTLSVRAQPSFGAARRWSGAGDLFDAEYRCLDVFDPALEWEQVEQHVRHAGAAEVRDLDAAGGSSSRIAAIRRLIPLWEYGHGLFNRLFDLSKLRTGNHFASRYLEPERADWYAATLRKRLREAPRIRVNFRPGAPWLPVTLLSTEKAEAPEAVNASTQLPFWALRRGLSIFVPGVAVSSRMRERPGIRSVVDRSAAGAARHDLPTRPRGLRRAQWLDSPWELFKKGGGRQILYHFGPGTSAHGEFGQINIGANGEELSAPVLETRLSGGISHLPHGEQLLLFFNGRKSAAQASIHGPDLVTVCLQARKDALRVIAPLLDVDGESSAELGSRTISHFLDGEKLGESLIKAADEMLSEGDPAGVLYCLVGDDATRLMADPLAPAVGPVEKIVALLTGQSAPQDVGGPQRLANCSIFLSYAGEDEECVMRVFEKLTAEGARCWVDKMNIRLGADIAQDVRKGLQQAQSLIVFLSGSAKESSWVDHEVCTAFEEKVRIFPVELQERSADRWRGPAGAHLRGAKRANWTGWRKPRTLAKKLEELVEELEAWRF
jgi:hypothetical protein